MTFTEWLDENWEKDNMFPPCLEPQKALLFLEEYLLGEDCLELLFLVNN